MQGVGVGTSAGAEPASHGVMGRDRLVRRNPDRGFGVGGPGEKWEGDPEICVKSGPEKCVGVFDGRVGRSA